MTRDIKDNSITLRRNELVDIVECEDYNELLSHIDFNTVMDSELNDDDLENLLSLLSEDLGENIINIWMTEDDYGNDIFVLDTDTDSDYY